MITFWSNRTETSRPSYSTGRSAQCHQPRHVGRDRGNCRPPRQGRRRARHSIPWSRSGGFRIGADISEFKENRKDRASAIAYNKIVEEAEVAIRNCPKPTVAMIFGFCMGGGMAIALACDLRFAAEGSRFGIPAAKLGIIYDFDAVVSSSTSSARLTQRIFCIPRVPFTPRRLSASVWFSAWYQRQNSRAKRSTT